VNPQKPFTNNLISPIDKYLFKLLKPELREIASARKKPIVYDIQFLL
jgi:hypothetical protein